MTSANEISCNGRRARVFEAKRKRDETGRSRFRLAGIVFREYRLFSARAVPAPSTFSTYYYILYRVLRNDGRARLESCGRQNKTNLCLQYISPFPACQR